MLHTLGFDCMGDANAKALKDQQLNQPSLNSQHARFDQQLTQPGISSLSVYSLCNAKSAFGLIAAPMPFHLSQLCNQPLSKQPSGNPVALGDLLHAAPHTFMPTRKSTFVKTNTIAITINPFILKLSCLAHLGDMALPLTASLCTCYTKQTRPCF